MRWGCPPERLLPKESAFPDLMTDQRIEDKQAIQIVEDRGNPREHSIECRDEREMSFICTRFYRW